MPTVIQRLACSPDGRTLLTLTQEGVARCQDVDTGKPVVGPLGVKGVARSLFSSDGKSVLTDGPDRTAQLWDVASAKLVREFSHADHAVTAAAFLPNDAGLVMAGGQAIRLWDVRTGQCVRELFQYAGEIGALAVSPDGRLLLTANDDHTARLWHTETGKPVGEPLQHHMKVPRRRFQPERRGGGHRRRRPCGPPVADGFRKTGRQADAS